MLPWDILPLTWSDQSLKFERPRHRFSLCLWLKALYFKKWGGDASNPLERPKFPTYFVKNKIILIFETCFTNRPTHRFTNLTTNQLPTYQLSPSTNPSTHCLNNKPTNWFLELAHSWILVGQEDLNKGWF